MMRLERREAEGYAAVGVPAEEGSELAIVGCAAEVVGLRVVVVACHRPAALGGQELEQDRASRKDRSA